MKRANVILLMMPFLVLSWGCEKKLPATVSGSITVDGETPTGNLAGEVMFHPSGGGAMAMAPLLADGTYVISTGATKGLEPGSYDVTVRVVENEPEPPGGYKNAPAQKPLAPSRYGDKKKSGLSAEVKPGKNEFVFDLDSK